MTIEEIIQNDIMIAIKSKDEVRLNTLRAIKTAIVTQKTSDTFSGTFTDEDALKIMQKMVKGREETASIYAENNRQELADREIAEANIIKEYLPKPMSTEEVEKAVKSIIEEIGASSMKDMGKVMGIASKKLNGRANGKTISEIVKRLLS